MRTKAYTLKRSQWEDGKQLDLWHAPGATVLALESSPPNFLFHETSKPHAFKSLFIAECIPSWYIYWNKVWGRVTERKRYLNCEQTEAWYHMTFIAGLSITILILSFQDICHVPTNKRAQFSKKHFFLWVRTTLVSPKLWHLTQLHLQLISYKHECNLLISIKYNSSS